MSINLAVEFDHPAAIAQMIQYARIDNTANPVFSTVTPNVAGSSGTVTIATNVPDGQYQINITPIYADGRVCDPTMVTTPPCDPLIAINASVVAGNIVISYTAPSQVPQVRMTVNFPNGGSFVANYVNDGNNIVVPIPAGLTGTFIVSGQSVCDPTSGFYSAFSNQVQVTIVANNVTIANFVSGITISNVTGISNFVLPSLVTFGQTVLGNHNAFFGGITCTFTGTPGSASQATLSLNGTIINCQNVPMTAGGTISFDPASFTATDQLAITFNNGTCP